MGQQNSSRVAPSGDEADTALVYFLAVVSGFCSFRGNTRETNPSPRSRWERDCAPRQRARREDVEYMRVKKGV